MQPLFPGISVILFASAAVLVAGFIRGYSGFGFAMVTIISLALVFPPAVVVPVVLLLEIAASSYLLPQVWRKIDWFSLRWLSLGVLVGTPLGVVVLSQAPARWMRIAIASLVIVMIGFMWRGLRFKKKPGRSATVTTGLISGTLNGAAAIGGPPVIIFFLSSQSGVAVSRASLIAYFLGTDALAFVICFSQGLIGLGTLTLTASLLIPLWIGIRLGSRSFLRTDPEQFRKRVMLLLLILSIVSIARSIL